MLVLIAGMQILSFLRHLWYIICDLSGCAVFFVQSVVLERGHCVIVRPCVTENSVIKQCQMRKNCPVLQPTYSHVCNRIAAKMRMRKFALCRQRASIHQSLYSQFALTKHAL